MIRKESKFKWWAETIGFMSALYLVFLIYNLTHAEYKLWITGTLSFSSKHFLLFSLLQWVIWMFFIFLMLFSLRLAKWLFLKGYILQFIGGILVILMSGVLTLSFSKPGEFLIWQQIIFAFLDLGSLVLIVLGINWRKKILNRQKNKS